ncbi:hypothetical protein Ocin01_17712 [Orchesella cincta]|uniref:Uncharacterized protein n=1 Tax=Orchesella cincta TaxID=48709 RepID=A0A1D2M7K8_ORCCI|nr:hypothetical protein Ocin01_17712 [Orchesella cincta]
MLVRDNLFAYVSFNLNCLQIQGSCPIIKTSNGQIAPQNKKKLNGEFTKIIIFVLYNLTLWLQLLHEGNGVELVKSLESLLFVYGHSTFCFIKWVVFQRRNAVAEVSNLFLQFERRNPYETSGTSTLKGFGPRIIKFILMIGISYGTLTAIPYTQATQVTEIISPQYLKTKGRAKATSKRNRKYKKHFDLVNQINSATLGTSISHCRLQDTPISITNTQKNTVGNSLPPEDNLLPPNVELRPKTRYLDSIFEPMDTEIPVSTTVTSAESESDSEQKEGMSLAFLASWSVKDNINATAVTELLKGLKRHDCFSHFPSDSRTLLKTPRSVQLKTVESRVIMRILTLPHLLRPYYLNFSQLSLRQQTPCDKIKIQVNIDGLPMQGSTTLAFWPILGLITKAKSPPFVIGIYSGTAKPKNIEAFLEDFLQNAKTLEESGIVLENSKNIQLNLDLSSATLQPTDKALPRLDEEFRQYSDDEHHMYCTPLTSLKMNMVEDFPFEYMHLVCLGVMKKLLLIWMRGDIKIFRLSSSQIERISERLISFRGYIPAIFSRKPRTLRDIDRWKATELRQFLMYTGPPALKGILGEVVEVQCFLETRDKKQLIIGHDQEAWKFFRRPM